MDNYLSSIDKYLEERQQDSENQQNMQTIDINSLLGDAESCLQSLPMSDSTNFTPFYNEQEMFFPSSNSTNTFETPDQTLKFMPFIHPSETNTTRKKPGRKPKGTSPAIRKAQNRAAQRAFRERKEKHVNDLEKMIYDLKLQRQKMASDMRQMKAKLHSSQVENWYMKGCLLSLQFLCLVNHLHLPLHMPYLEKEYVSNIKGITPIAEVAYFDAKTRNDKILEILNETTTTEEEISTFEEYEDQLSQIWLQKPEKVPEKPRELDEQATTNMEAIEIIRKLLSPYQSGESESSFRMKPTLLQQTVPHDPRINIIPLPYMRDRMIIFKNMIDFDKLFDIMINEAVFLGGDPTLSKSWELPPHVFDEYWFLRIKLDSQKAFAWRRARGLPEYSSKDWNIFPEPANFSDMQSVIQTSNYSPESSLYKNFTQSPQSRKTIYPPTLENIIKAMELN